MWHSPSSSCAGNTPAAPVGSQKIPPRLDRQTDKLPLLLGRARDAQQDVPCSPSTTFLWETFGTAQAGFVPVLSHVNHGNSGLQPPSITPGRWGAPHHVPALLVALVKSHLHLLNRGSLLDVDELTAVLIRFAKSFRIKVLRKYRMIKIQLWKMQHASCFLFCLAKQRH